MKNDQLCTIQRTRDALQKLERKGVLHRELVATRNIIRAATSDVECLGLDVPAWTWWLDPQPPENFHPASLVVSGWVAYAGGRALLTATQGRWNKQGHLLDPATHFPANVIATVLLAQDCTRRASVWHDPDRDCVGDAILKTDRRLRWIVREPFSFGGNDELQTFNALLKTPRTLVTSDPQDQIIFHETPCDEDVIAMILRWV